MKSLVPALSLLLLGCGGESVNGTLIVVQVESDLAVPAQLDRVQITADTASGGVTRVFPLTAGSLPVVLGIVPEGKSSGELTVTVSGSAQNQPVLTQIAATAFVPNQARKLVVFLGSNCLGVAPGCGAGKTCRGGACVGLGEGVALQPYPDVGGTPDGAVTPDGSGSETSLTPDAVNDLGPPDMSVPPPDAAADAATDTGPMVCTAPNTMCGATCTNLQTDGTHCGACNRSCQGGPCSGGMCTPVMLASAQDNPTHLTVDDAFLYWRRGQGNAGSIGRARKDGSALTQLVGALDGQGVMAVDGTHLFYFANSNIFSCPTNNCPMPLRLAPTMPTMSLGINIIDVQLNPSKARVFWTDHQKIFSVPAAGGAAAQTHLTDDFPSNSLAVDNSFIYYVDRDPMGNIGIRKRTAVDPPALAMIINFPAGTGFPRQIAVTADRLLWVGTGIFSSPLDPPTKIPPSPLATGSPTRFAIDGNTLFWGEFASASSGRIYSCPITGCRGSPTVIAATCGVGFLAVDATSVYWICGAMGTVMKVAR